MFAIFNDRLAQPSLAKTSATSQHNATIPILDSVIDYRSISVRRPVAFRFTGSRIYSQPGAVVILQELRRKFEIAFAQWKIPSDIRFTNVQFPGKAQKAVEQMIAPERNVLLNEKTVKISRPFAVKTDFYR